MDDYVATFGVKNTSICMFHCSWRLILVPICVKMSRLSKTLYVNLFYQYFETILTSLFERDKGILLNWSSIGSFASNLGITIFWKSTLVLNKNPINYSWLQLCQALLWFASIELLLLTFWFRFVTTLISTINFMTMNFDYLNYVTPT